MLVGVIFMQVIILFTQLYNTNSKRNFPPKLFAINHTRHNPYPVTCLSARLKAMHPAARRFIINTQCAFEGPNELNNTISFRNEKKKFVLFPCQLINCIERI